MGPITTQNKHVVKILWDNLYPSTLLYLKFLIEFYRIIFSLNGRINNFIYKHNINNLIVTTIIIKIPYLGGKKQIKKFILLNFNPTSLPLFATLKIKFKNIYYNDDKKKKM